MPPALPGPVRTIVERIFPPGALILSVLTFGYFAMGIVRNRVFANTYGAGAELDAYNAAFRIPEIALDVLVAAGLTAPFVPIFTSLRRGGDAAANDFGRTVLTGAVVVMSVAIGLIFLLAPWLATQVGRGFDAPTQELYIQLLRINCLAQILFAASICIGEVLVANRRFLFYALAPILYTTGIILGTVLGAERFGIVATAWGAVFGAVAHLGIRAIGTLRTTFRIRPSFHFRTPAFREFIRLMLPRMLSHPIEPLLFTYFTILASTFAVGSVSAVNFAADYQVVPVSLIGVSFSLAVFPVLSSAYADADRAAFSQVLRRNLVTIGGLTIVAAVAAVHLLRAARRRAPGRWRVRCRGRRDHLGGRRGLRPLGAVRCPRLPALARAVRDPRHHPPGRGVVRRVRDRAAGVHPDRAGRRDPGHPAGLRRGHGRQGHAAGDLPHAARPRDRPGQPAVPGAGSVGTTVMNRPSRSG